MGAVKSKTINFFVCVKRRDCASRTKWKRGFIFFCSSGQNLHTAKKRKASLLVVWFQIIFYKIGLKNRTMGFAGETTFVPIVQMI